MTTSLELSRELEAAGVEQKSEYWWCEKMNSYKWTAVFELKHSCPVVYEPNRHISAYTLEELIALCGDGFESLTKCEGEQGWYFWASASGERNREFEGTTPCEAVGKLLLRLQSGTL